MFLMSSVRFNLIHLPLALCLFVHPKYPAIESRGTWSCKGRCPSRPSDYRQKLTEPGKEKKESKLISGMICISKHDRVA
jgi:hypothetical protein